MSKRAAMKVLETKKDMVPHGMALGYVSGGPFTLKWKSGEPCGDLGDAWCYVYQGRKGVWSCNGRFALTWFRKA